MRRTSSGLVASVLITVCGLSVAGAGITATMIPRDPTSISSVRVTLRIVPIAAQPAIRGLHNAATIRLTTPATRIGSDTTLGVSATGSLPGDWGDALVQGAVGFGAKLMLAIRGGIA